MKPRLVSRSSSAPNNTHGARAHAQVPQREQPRAVQRPPATTEPGAIFRTSLSPHSRAFAEKLRGERRVDRNELLAIAAQHNRSFTRTIDGLRLAAEKAGWRPEDVYTIEGEGFGAKKITYYVAGKKLLANEL